MEMEKEKVLTYNGLPECSGDLSYLYKQYILNYSFLDIIKSLDKIPPSFTLTVNGNKYQCHTEILIAISEVISQQISKNPELTEYSFSFDDSKFNLFIDFLNGKVVPITDENRSYFETISQAIGFTPIHDFQLLKELNLRNYGTYFQKIIPILPKTLIIQNATSQFQVNRLISFTYCQKLKNNSISIDASDISDISNFLSGRQLPINFDNLQIVQSCATQLEIPFIENITKSIAQRYDYINSVISTINLQDTIFTLTDENCSDVYQLIKKSDFLTNSTFLYQFFLAIELFYNCRPLSETAIVKFLSIVSEDNKSSFHGWLVDYLILRAITQYFNPSFVRALYDSGFLIFDDVKAIHGSIGHDRNFTYTYTLLASTLFSFFAHEFKEHDNATFESYLAHNRQNGFYNNQSEIEAVKKYEGNWDKFDIDVKAHRRQGLLCEAIYKDDIDAFQQISAEDPHFDFDKKLDKFVYEASSLLRSNVTYIQLAAFYGSIQCFQFLSLRTTDLKDVPVFAIFGGKSEIIHILEQKGCSFEKMHQMAIRYHRNDIYQYLVSKIGPVKPVYSVDYRETIACPAVVALESFNHRIFLSYYDDGINNDIMNSNLTLISTAVAYHNIDAVKLLLKTMNVNPNQYGAGHDRALIYVAACLHETEIVKMLVEIGHCDLPKSKVKGYAAKNPLLAAGEYGYDDIVEYLAPFYKNDIDDEYLERARNDKIREIELRAKQSK